MRFPFRVLVLGIAIFSILPVVNWIPGELQATWYGIVATQWLYGSLIAVGLAVVLAIISTRLISTERLETLGPSGDLQRYLPLISLVALMSYLAVALWVFDRRPLQIDEIVQAFQAKIFASGRLWKPAFSYPEFFSAFNVVDADGRVYGQFPPGGPAMLALGALVGATWITGPIAGAISVWLAGRLFFHAESRPAVALGATLLFAFGPFVLFMSGTHMNHVTTLTWLLVYLLGTAVVLSAGRSRPGIAAAAGLGLGIAATIRPLDAVAFAVPGAAWYALTAIRDRQRLRDGLSWLAGLAVPILLMLGLNAAMTGSPLRFAYNVAWGNEVGLGFHPSPWGEPHTLARAIALTNLYLLRLHVYLFEWPIPSVLLALAAIVGVKRLDPVDRYLLACVAMIVGGYALYWHDGFYLGPRFLFAVTPILALWTARFPALFQDSGRPQVFRAALGTVVVSVIIAITSIIPERAGQYATGLRNIRWNPDSAAAAAGVTNAVVLVRESWGAQLLARLWALDVSRTEAERLYRRVDACRLEEAVLALERESPSADAMTRLRPLLGDSADVVRSPFSPDPTLRWHPQAIYSPRCRQRLQEDAEGFTVFPPLLLSSRDDLVFARDLHERNTVLLDAYPDRRVYLLKPPRAGGWSEFRQLSRDSLLGAYGNSIP